MRKLILILASILFCLLACCSAFGQDVMKEHNIAEHLILGDTRIIRGTPCVGHYDGVPVIIKYRYFGQDGGHCVMLECVCEKQKTWWTVNEGNKALVKLLGGSSQSMTFTTVKSEAIKDRISFVLAINEGFDKLALGITDILFRVSYGKPESIKIHLDEQNQMHLHKQYLYIMTAAGL
jgi:hypothetical protein